MTALRPDSFEEAKEAWKKQDEWRRESASRYEDRVRDEADSKYRDIKRRGVKETHKDDPDRYGDAFLAVREEPCFGLTYLPDHECGIGVAPPSAHHLGEKDSEGLVPVCGKLHDRLEERWWEVEEELEEAGSPTLEELGQKYLEEAA